MKNLLILSLIFIILCLVDIFRNLFSPYHSKLSVFVMGSINTILISVCCIISAFINKQFYLVVSQALNLFSAYDSITLIINATIFCVIFSLFLEEIIKKRYFQLQLKKPEKSKRTQNIETMVQLIKHLYKDEDSME